MTALDAALLAAHAAENQVQLIALYTQAADEAQTPEAQGFYLTHAYVYALEAGHPAAPRLRERLIREGREEPLPADTASKTYVS